MCNFTDGLYGIACAIILIMSEPTVILAIASVVAHCLAIFWPRKPLKERLDQNGFPILWCNNDEKHDDIACVWRVAAEHGVSDVDEHGTHRRSA
jgi:hypothetical protein